MAKLNLDIVVNGEEQVEALNQSLVTTEKKTSKLNSGFKKLYTSLNAVATVGVVTAFSALGVVIGSVVRAGVGFNSSMEEQKAGLTALAMAVNTDAIPATEKLTLAQQEAAVVMEELILINAKTPHSLEQTNEIYKTMYVSMKNAGASTREIIDLTQKLSVASGVAGVEFNSLLAGVDGLATGTVLANSSLGRFLGALGLTNDALKDTNDVVGLVSEKLKDFTGFSTMAGSISNLRNEWAMLGGELTKDIFASVKMGLDEASGKMHSLGAEGIGVLKEKFNSLAVVMATAAGGMVKAVAWLAEKIYAVTVLFENAWLQASNLFSWNDKLQKQVEDNRQSFVSFKEGVQGANEAIDNIVGAFKNGIEVAKEQSDSLKAIGVLTKELTVMKADLAKAIAFEHDAEVMLKSIRDLSSTTNEELVAQEQILATSRDIVIYETNKVRDAELSLVAAKKESGVKSITLAEKTKILSASRKADTKATDDSTAASKRRTLQLAKEISQQIELSRAIWETTWALGKGESTSDLADFANPDVNKGGFTPLHESDFGNSFSDNVDEMSASSDKATDSVDNLSSSLSNLNNTNGAASAGFTSFADDFVVDANRVGKASRDLSGVLRSTGFSMKGKGRGSTSNYTMASHAEKRRNTPTSMHTAMDSYGMSSGSNDLATGGYYYGTSFSSGGYTGTGRDDEVAGIVHKNEYVLTAKETKEMGMGSGNNMGFKDMVDYLRKISKDMEDMLLFNRQLLSVNIQGFNL